ncbi:hypothetical protein [Massilia antarctica]|uniref:hypothetical protein n=1 Tax=Massilia antarctica TaxID=2765360 RepID=UPI0006BD2827|nr:hypothetical protein [Massilia sp. H27-R4]MCY0911626.1 hypothetical protein [Massilia sp. H27-R4]CUI04752.1 hypothetical protein BN2497_4281 [Janthinobacterium sp. CG23_2]CUU28538.1 hypothetical protein BN3177_4281 [Janthinobacterium sp. CG23_2]
MEAIDEQPDFAIAEKLIRQLLNENAAHLDAESKDFVRHYLDHDEYKMAFEGLFLELIATGTFHSSENLAVYVALGKALNLDSRS